MTLPNGRIEVCREKDAGTDTATVKINIEGNANVFYNSNKLSSKESCFTENL
jgi:hypothetical protein